MASSNAHGRRNKKPKFHFVTIERKAASSFRIWREWRPQASEFGANGGLKLLRVRDKGPDALGHLVGGAAILIEAEAELLLAHLAPSKVVILARSSLTNQIQLVPSW